MDTNIIRITFYYFNSSKIHMSILKLAFVKEAIWNLNYDSFVSRLPEYSLYKMCNLIRFPYCYDLNGILEHLQTKLGKLLLMKSHKYSVFFNLFSKTKKESCVGIIRNSPIYDKNVFRIILKLSG